MKTKITQFPDGVRLNISRSVYQHRRGDQKKKETVLLLSHKLHWQIKTYNVRTKEAYSGKAFL